MSTPKSSKRKQPTPAKLIAASLRHLTPEEIASELNGRRALPCAGRGVFGKCIKAAVYQAIASFIHSKGRITSTQRFLYCEYHARYFSEQHGIEMPRIAP